MLLANRYLLIEKLGEGSFGEVFRALDQSSMRTVAIKLLHRQDYDSRYRFYREAVVLHDQLGNEYVVTLLEHSGLDADDPYLVLEFCALGSLRSWVGAGRGWRDVATALLHAAKGLTGLHEAGGFHRDIKPENMLVARASSLPGWRVKLADFGLAGLPNAATGKMTFNACGTPGYIAPELLGGAEFHPAADLYSLGITGVELLVGRTDVAALQTCGAPPPLIALVRSMVSGRAEVRPTARGVAESLEALLTSAPVVPARGTAGNKTNNKGVGWFLAALGTAIALGTMNTKDANGRFHGSDGKFRSGRWG